MGFAGFVAVCFECHAFHFSCLLGFVFLLILFMGLGITPIAYGGVLEIIVASMMPMVGNSPRGWESMIGESAK